MDRETVVFYKDWWMAIKSLPEEKLPEAIAAVMDYAFDGIEPTDPMLRFATAQMRMFIDRDAKRYQEICAKRKEAIEKRWARQKESASDNDAQASSDNCVHTNTNVCESIETNTPQYLNENVNGNENVNVNGNGNVNDNGQKIINNSLLTDHNAHTRAKVGQSVGGRSLDDKVAGSDEEKAGGSLDKKIAECKRSPIWKEGVRKKFHLGDTKEVDHLLEEFAADMLCQETEVRHPKKLFISWLSEKRQKETYPGNPGSGLGVGEWRDQSGRRRYAKSDVIVPEYAPPRPSAGHWWSEPSRAWCNQI